MRILITSASIMLGTILCFASCAQAVNQTEVDAMWAKAKDCYQEQLLNSTIDGATSSTKRHTKMTPESEEMNENSNIYAIYEKMMVEKHHLTKRQVSGTQTPAVCRIPTTTCAGAGNSRYRNIDGTCNNLNNRLWGSRNRAFERVVPVGYEDGRSVPRGNFNSYLPNPRFISTSIHWDNNPVNRFVTNMVPQFGQFLDHDISLTPEANGQCCQNPRSNVDCWAITIPNNDQFYSRRAVPQRCMDFTRSTTCNANGVRQQMNMNTAYIDASQIYGSDPQRTRALREFRGGRLATNPSLNGFLPTGTQRGIQVQGTFVAGDDRINEMPGLVVMHNLFIMEHNRIAQLLGQRNSRLSDEVLFEEAKRINTAIIQNIVYNEYLPVILGNNAMDEYGLWSTTGFSQYNPQTDATIFNSFATAAYRFGHSMVAGIVRLISGNNAQVGSYNIRDHYFQSTQVTQSNGQGYDLILRSLMTQNAPEMDRHVSDGVSNFLFRQQGNDFGGDLIARNIQRGRDHGLRGYGAFREVCGLPALGNWNNPPREISSENWNAARNVYGNSVGPERMDLFTAGLLEMPTNGGLTGPTFQCLKAVQFKRLKDGDRYFFSHSGQNTGNVGFNSQQIAELRRQMLGDVICRNSQQPNAARNVFLVPSNNNPSISCPSRNKLNIALF